MPNEFKLREEWLRELGLLLEPIFLDLGYPSVPKYKVSCGFTSKGVRGKAIGECFHSKCSALEVHEIFIHPKLADPLDVAATVAHEIAHCVAGIEAKHGPVFKKVATKLGLEGKMTATVPGDSFKKMIAPLLEKVGPYPHGALSGGGTTGPKQPTRLLKVVCRECGYVVRVTQKWVELGLPQCGNLECESRGELMRVEVKGEEN